MVDDILENFQCYFYFLKMGGLNFEFEIIEDVNLEKCEIDEVVEEFFMQLLVSIYIFEEYCIWDVVYIVGYRVLIFSKVFKFDLFFLVDLFFEVLEMGQEVMGCFVEFEFFINWLKDFKFKL